MNINCSYSNLSFDVYQETNHGKQLVEANTTQLLFRLLEGVFQEMLGLTEVINTCITHITTLEKDNEEQKNGFQQFKENNNDRFQQILTSNKYNRLGPLVDCITILEKKAITLGAHVQWLEENGEFQANNGLTTKAMLEACSVTTFYAAWYMKM